METRPLGDTGHESSILTFGTIALDSLDQPAANRMVEDVLDAGVNHFDDHESEALVSQPERVAFR